MNRQICNKCNEPKQSKEFSKGTSLLGLHYTCKLCMKNYQEKYQKENKDKIKRVQKKYIENNKKEIIARTKKWRRENKEHQKNYQRQYISQNKSKVVKISKNYYERNKIKIRKKQKKYREENKEKIKDIARYYNQNNKEKRNNQRKERRKTDPLYKLKNNLRSRIYSILKNTKSKKTEEILGASFEEVRLHLESTFQDGMTWENHGRCGSEANCDEIWHIDHKIPFASAKTKEEVYKLCHYTNLQALWGIDNLYKSDNY